MGKKLSIKKIFLLSSLVAVVPFSFACGKKSDIQKEVVKANTSSSALTPLTNEEIMSLGDGDTGYYLMCAVEDESLHLLTLNQYSPFEMKDIAYTGNYEIDIQENLLNVIQGMLEISILEDYTPALYMKIASMEYCKYFHYTDQEYSMILSTSDYGYPFYYNAGEVGLNIHTYTNNSGTEGTTQVDYNFYFESENDYFTLSTENKSEFLLYRLDDSFVKANNWQKKFLAISENSNPESLQMMWQGLSYYDKSYILDCFYVDPASGGSESQYGSEGKEKELATLKDQFLLYESLVSTITQYPFRCMDVDSNSIKINYSTFRLSGLNKLDSFMFVSEEDSFFVEFDGTGQMYINNGDYFLLGGEFDLYYCIGYNEDTYSETPVHLTFKSQCEQTIPLDGIDLATSPVYISDGEELMQNNIFSNSFELEEIPSGYEVVLITESCFSNNLEIFSDDETYYYFNTNDVPYSDQTTNFHQAYDENWSLVDLQEETSYYLVYRLKETLQYTPSDVCGYFEISTISNDESVVKQAEISNYSIYTSLENLDRFQEALATDNDKYHYMESFFESMYDTISNLSQIELEQYLEERSLEDRYYYQANYVLLLVYGESLVNDRYISAFSSRLEEYISTYSEGSFDQKEMDEFVDSLLYSLEQEIDLYALQEEAAREISLYFNEVINNQFTLDIPEDVWAMLSNYLKQIYETSSKKEIDNLVLSFKEQLNAFFISNDGENNNG